MKNNNLWSSEMLCALISSIRVMQFKPIIYCQFLMNNKGKGALFKPLMLAFIIRALNSTLMNWLMVLLWTFYHIYVTHIHTRAHTHTVALTVRVLANTSVVFCLVLSTCLNKFEAQWQMLSWSSFIKFLETSWRTTYWYKSKLKIQIPFDPPILWAKFWFQIFEDFICTKDIS